MIDWTRVHELRNEVGPDDFMEIVEIFLEEVEEVIDRLRNVVDRTGLMNDLHFLKGSALNLGFEDFSGLCHIGERLSADGAADEVDLGTLIGAYEASRTAFKEKLGEL